MADPLAKTSQNDTPVRPTVLTGSRLVALCAFILVPSKGMTCNAPAKVTVDGWVARALSDSEPLLAKMDVAIISPNDTKVVSVSNGKTDVTVVFRVQSTYPGQAGYITNSSSIAIQYITSGDGITPPVVTPSTTRGGANGMLIREADGGYYLSDYLFMNGSTTPVIYSKFKKDEQANYSFAECFAASLVIFSGATVLQYARNMVREQKAIMGQKVSQAAMVGIYTGLVLAWGLEFVGVIACQYLNKK
ncbi:MAG: hypothetical protein V4479_16020 [Actinomycetota bacterium]